MGNLTPAHLGVLRRLAERAHITNSDVGMDASVLAALLDLVSAPSDFPPAENTAAPEHIVRCYARIHRLTTERDEAMAEAERLRAALLHYTDATIVTSWGGQELGDNGGVAREALGLPDHSDGCEWPDGECSCAAVAADAPTLTPADLAAARAQALRLLNHDEES